MMKRTGALAAAALAAAMTLSACGGDDANEQSGSPESVNTISSTSARDVALAWGNASTCDQIEALLAPEAWEDWYGADSSNCDDSGVEDEYDGACIFGEERPAPDSDEFTLGYEETTLIEIKCSETDPENASGYSVGLAKVDGQWKVTHK